ncbi:MAG: tetratricopeptide repeat protein [Gammaproteobacteria bacterium]
MRMPDITLYLVTALVCTDAAAFQLGQLTRHSRLGEPLDARVTLYGLSPTAAATTPPAVTVKPAIGLPPGSSARRAAESIAATLATDTSGMPYLALRSSAPVTEASFDFRLRVTFAGETMIAHYTVALDTAPRVRPDVATARSRPTAALRPVSRTVPAAPTVARATPDADSASRYGPVRPGQSLWRILRERGLHRRDRQAVIERILADNPHAFIDGNADRLRVGVMLNLPGPPASERAGAAQSRTGEPPARPIPAPAAVTQHPAESRALPPTTAAGLDGDAAAMAARLEALSAKFADIRARYAAQETSGTTATTPQSTPSAEIASDTGSVTDSRVGEAAMVEPGAADTLPTAADTLPTAADTAATADNAASAPATSLSTYILLGAGALISGLALVAGILMAMRASRRRRLHGRDRTTEQALVAEITRKAEKRLLLEDSVKRRMSQNRQAATAAAGQLHEADLHEVDHRIAHGQYAEARALLGDVITAAPDNFRAKLRLAEICYLDENRAAFVAIADDLYRRHRADIGDEGWQRVMRMGRVLVPDQPPFSGPVVLGRQA